VSSVPKKRVHDIFGRMRAENFYSKKEQRVNESRDEGGSDEG
jgi:hypothetical protein